MESTPEFYTGAPVDPVDLRFREAFLAELWQTLRTGHVVLTAPRRTGKTSVMDYLRDHQRFNQLMLDLENDFYIEEVGKEVYDFASGVLKSWWRKYHA